MIAGFKDKFVGGLIMEALSVIDDTLCQFSREQTRVDTLISPTTYTICDSDNIIVAIGRIFSTAVLLAIVWDNHSLALEEGAWIVSFSSVGSHR